METKMTNRIALLLALTLTAACGTPNTKDDLTKAEAQALVENGDADDDICAEAGFNDDDVCDDWCPDGDDRDCAVSNMCEEGDTKDADDGCNTCTCLDGSWACTEIGCAPNNPPAVCEDGDTKDAEDGCNTCGCHDGQWACTEIACEPNNNPDPNKPQLLEIGDCSDDGDDKAINSVTLSGDTLTVSASFSGGCAEHTITACWDGSFLESFPVQARIKLIHDANGDSCEAYLTQDFTYDLTPMREAYVDGYQTEEGTILLGVEDLGAEYTF